MHNKFVWVTQIPFAVTSGKALHAAHRSFILSRAEKMTPHWLHEAAASDTN
jgi:hypothetical protein